jgi:hypothetical protein
MKHIIQVTEEDIKLGKRRTTHCCPVALALNRYFNKATAMVTECIYLDHRPLVNAPHNVCLFIVAFDGWTHEDFPRSLTFRNMHLWIDELKANPVPILPFTFELELP